MIFVPIDPYVYDSITRLGGLKKPVRRVSKVEKSAGTHIYDEDHLAAETTPIYRGRNRRLQERRVTPRPKFKRSLQYDTRARIDRRKRRRPAVDSLD